MSLDKCLIKHVPRAYWDEVKKYAEAYKKRGMTDDEANLRAAEDMVKMVDAELARVEGEVVAAYEKSPLYQKETENAVQERGAAEVPVGERTEARQEVGEGNTQRQETAGEGSAEERFEPSLIEKMRVPGYKSREKLVEMSIDDFLALAKLGYGEGKFSDAKKILDRGGKFSSLPFLQFDGERVIGHEGRHRAMALRAAGYKTMPVILRSPSVRWSEQSNPANFDYSKDWPTELRAEEGAANENFSIPFPVKREDAMKPYAAGEGAAQREKLIREGRNYEGLLFSGAYGVFQYRTAPKDSPKRKMVEAARERYNAIRAELGLEPVTDWGTRPEVLVDRLPYDVNPAPTDDELDKLLDDMIDRAFVENQFYESVRTAKTLGEALKLARGKASIEAQALIDGLLTLPQAMSAGFSITKSKGPKIGEKATAGGMYYRANHSVSLYQKSNLVTLLHEAVHAATVSSLNVHIYSEKGKTYAKTKEGEELVRLYEAAKKALDERGGGKQYGMTDVSEFVAEAFADTDFQTFLASVPYAGTKKSMWDKFTELVNKMLRTLKLAADLTGASRPDVQKNSLLNAVIAASAERMQDNEQMFAALASPELAAQEIDEVAGFDRLLDRMSREGILPPSSDGPKYAPVKAAEAKQKYDDIKVNTLGKMRRGLMQFMFLRDLMREKGGILKGKNDKSLVEEYVMKVFEMSSAANELLKESSKIAKRWENLGKEATQLSELAADATYSQIHPDIPLDMENHETTIPGKMISNRHLADENGNFSEQVRAQHKDLREQYAAMSNDARMVYKQARDNMAKNWDKREGLLNEVARAVYEPQIQQAEKDGNTKLANKLRRDYRAYLVEVGAALSRLNGPYFPLERFGQFYVVYKSEEYTDAEAELKQANDEFAKLMEEYDVPAGEERRVLERADAVNEKAGAEQKFKLTDEQKTAIKAARKKLTEARKKVDKLAGDPTAYRNEAFEDEAAARALAKELGAKVHLQQEQLQEVFGISKALVNKVSDYVAAGMPEGQSKEVRKAMLDIFLKSKPDTSATRNEIRRRNVAGFSRDMLRGYAEYSKRDAHYLSRLEFTDEITELLHDVNKAAKASDSLEAEELANELARRHKASLNYVETPGQDLISSTAFVWQLALSPSFWLINTTQPWMVSYPFMMGRHKMGRTAEALKTATVDTFKAMKTSMKEQNTVFFEVDTSKFAGDEKEMLDSMLKAGLLDITLEMDVGAIAEGKATTSTTGKITRAVSLVPHQIEVANRVATALAAYRLEKQKLGAMPGAKQSAIEYAERVLDKTHFDYSATNAPYWLKPGVFPFSKVLFQYRKYQIGVLSLVATQWKQALKGATAEERREAKNALFGLAATHGALAGAVGLPFASTAFFIADVIAKAFGDDDEPWPGAEVVFRNWLADSIGVEAAAVVAKGLPMALGVDLSGRLGMGDIGTPIKLLRDNKEGRDLYLEILAGAAGPAIGGLGAKAFDGVQYISQGDIVKGAEQFLPKMFSDMLKAHRIGEEGVTTRKGMVALAPDRIGPMETMLTALGIPVNDITERGEAVGAFESVKKQLQDRRAELTKAYIEAREKGDNDRMIGIRNAVREYNAKRRAAGEKLLTEAELLQAYQQRRRTQKEFTEQGILARKSERPLTRYSRFAEME